jgi:hypothetical protein
VPSFKSFEEKKKSDGEEEEEEEEEERNSISLDKFRTKYKSKE